MAGGQVFRPIWGAVSYAFISCLVGCGGFASTSQNPPVPPQPSNCDPGVAPQVISVTVQNVATENISDFPVAVVLDSTNFDFTSVATDGSTLGVWNPQNAQPLPFWTESYDASLGKALIWTKVSAASQTSTTVWLTAGSIPHCSAQSSNGYAVFPFFSDVQDVNNWTTDHLTLSDKIQTGPLTIQNRQVIQSDGTYNSTPAVVQAANGDWLLTYRKGVGHVNSPLVILRRSSDQGTTWSPEVAYWDTTGNDPSLARTPAGDLLIEFVKKDTNGVSGAAYSRSTDSGLTWAPFTFFDQPVNNTSALPTLFVRDGSAMYAAGYGPSTVGTGFSPFFWFSSDDGFTWVKRSELRTSTDPGMNETAIAETSPGSFLAISRADDGLNTYGRISNDYGMTWGPLASYTSQVGVLQLPQFIQAGPVLLLFGREVFFFTTQLVAYASYDGGQTFGYGTVLDHYLNNPVDGGYCWPMLLPDGRLFVVFYTDPSGLRLPDIQSLYLQIKTPQLIPANAIHLTSQFEQALAARALNSTSQHYSLDFRFRTHDAPGGNQFAVLMQDATVQPAITIVNWELPAQFPAGAGFLANGQLITLFSSFSYDQPYRVRTTVDEIAGQQQGEILDQFGATIAASPVEPFAQGTTSHPTQILIGNNAPHRNVDALLEFLFVRPVATADPQITIARMH